MTSRDFVYWLQGLFELGEVKQLNEKQTEIIKKHLNLVFKHEIDPSYGDKQHQEELQEIHDNINYPPFPPQPWDGRTDVRIKC